MKITRSRLFVIFILFVVVIIGPWPVFESHYQNSTYANKTFSSIDQIPPAVSQPAELFAGVATVDITPPVGVELGGYSARDPKTSEGVMKPVFAKAITLRNGAQTVTLLSAEILLPLPKLVQAVVKKTGFSRQEIFFTATHTHSGPGAYADGFISSMTLGEFNPQQFEFLSNQLTNAVITSRENLKPVVLNYRRIEFSSEIAQHYIRDQLNSPSQAHNSLHILEILTEEDKQRMAALFTFSAHPTLLGRRNKLISGDYPGEVMATLEKELPGTFLFAAGAMGGMLSKAENDDAVSKIEAERLQLHDMSKRFSALLLDLFRNKEQLQESFISESWSSDHAVIDSELIPVQLPSPSYRLNNYLRLSPLLVKQIFHGDETYVHALRIGKVLFLGYPADYSGELAKTIEVWAHTYKVYPWATSFNGDYIGYIMPSRHYDKTHYSVRDVSFYGRWNGDYFTDISQRLLLKLFPNPDQNHASAALN